MINNWKTVLTIYSGVGIAKGEYKYKEANITVDVIESLKHGSVSVYTDNGSKFRLVTIKLESKSENIEEIFLRSYQLCYEFLSRISLIGYCITEIVNHLITTIEFCEVGVRFEVLSTEIIHTRNFKREINPDDFSKIHVSESSDNYLEVALGFLRKALSTKSLEEKISNLYASLERIADEESNEFKIDKCKNCGQEEKRDFKLTKKFIKELLSKKGVSNKAISNFTDRDRNKIAHGLGKRDVQFYTDLKESVIKVQHAIVEIIAEKHSANFVNSITTIIEKPRVVYGFKYLGNDLYQLDESDGSHKVRMATMAAISKIENSSEDAKANGEFNFGVSFGKDNLYLTNNAFQKEFFPKSISPTQSGGIIYNYTGNKDQGNKYPLKLYLE